jgi:putative heme-binding domain-containing protein
MKNTYSLLSAWLMLILASTVWGQTGPNPFAGNAQAELEGGRTFAISCAPCHGINGEGAQGQSEHLKPPDLTRGMFRHGSRDEDLFGTITNGIAAGGMPSFAQLGTDRIWQLVAYVRSLSRPDVVPKGNAQAGETLFWGKGDCGSCHAVGSKGVSLGPDLAHGSRRMNVTRLKKAIVAPNDEITAGYEMVTVVTSDHKTITGLVRFFDNFSCRLIDSSGQEHTYLRDNVISMKREMRSVMPDNYGKLFSDSELDDLVAYIYKIRSEANPR